MRKSVESFPLYLNQGGVPAARDGNERDERRRRTRVQVHWQVRFHQRGTAESLETITHDLSSDGFYFLAQTAFIPGELRPCTLGVPTHHPHNGDQVLPVECMVRIVRVESLGDEGLYGMGCCIEDYRFVPPANGGGKSSDGRRFGEKFPTAAD